MTDAEWVSGKQIHDANIVATMLSSGVSVILTLDPGGFARFDHLVKRLDLPAEESG